MASTSVRLRASRALAGPGQRERGWDRDIGAGTAGTGPGLGPGQRSAALPRAAAVPAACEGTAPCPVHPAAPSGGAGAAPRLLGRRRAAPGLPGQPAGRAAAPLPALAGLSSVPGPPCPPRSAADGAARLAPLPARAPGGAAAGVLSTKAYPECLLPVENSKPVFLSQMDPPREAAAQDDPLVLLEDSRGPEDDVFISQYATGQKEALRAALMQKTQVIPVHKEVKVQLLGSASTEKREGAGDDTRSAPREVESATTIAAATAAAIATTAPLLKVQNALEAKVNSVSELLQKLQETDRQLQRASEQQKKVKAQHEEPHYHQRVSKLEKQMNAFMVQIQHLEKLQEQQMNIQSYLISSAVNTRGLQLCSVPVPGPLAGHWEKPGQRSLTNEAPSSHRGLFPATAAPAQGEGKGLEHILNSQETPLKQVEYSKKAALNSNERSWHSERHRHKAFPPDAISSFESYSSIEKTVQKAGHLLQDLGKLRREMHNILQEATTWKSDMNDLIKAKNPPVAADTPEHHLVSKPSILQNIQVPRSILTDAERILRGVQNNKKVLEENLEAVSHAKDGDAMYAFSNSLTTNRDVLEEIRIRRTVDERIKEISEEFQAEMARNYSEQGKHDQKCTKRAQNLRAVKTKKETKEKTQNNQGCLTKKLLPAAKPLLKEVEDNTRKQKFRTYFSENVKSKERRADGAVGGISLTQYEDYLSLVYGKPIYQGHRSTLKKGPYLRFNSPSPKSKPPRPKLIETVRGK
ncbi:TALPID3 protein-like isoform X2 [Taeniopygia guttata]|uniref:TALPID3 protein-like isoform X2 n=1 Tax=Taeniopygia guttata TaxID=59729 RepID=UPI003BB95E08